MWWQPNSASLKRAEPPKSVDGFSVAGPPVNFDRLRRAGRRVTVAAYAESPERNRPRFGRVVGGFFACRKRAIEHPGVALQFRKRNRSEPSISPPPIGWPQAWPAFLFSARTDNYNLYLTKRIGSQ